MKNFKARGSDRGLFSNPNLQAFTPNELKSECYLHKVLFVVRESGLV